MEVTAHEATVGDTAQCKGDENQNNSHDTEAAKGFTSSSKLHINTKINVKRSENDIRQARRGKFTVVKCRAPMHTSSRHIHPLIPSGRGGGIMFTNMKPPQHIPCIHTQTIIIVFAKASLSHSVSQEVLSPKHKPVNYQPHVKNAVLQIPAHYVVMYERCMSYPLLTC